jgi:hypothetical protein
MTTFTDEQAESLGDSITDWTWIYDEARVDDAKFGPVWHQELEAVLRIHSMPDAFQHTVPDAQVDSLVRQITAWAKVWTKAADAGSADSDFGMEWRHSLQRYLAVASDARDVWLAAPKSNKIATVHILTADGV